MRCEQVARHTAIVVGSLLLLSLHTRAVAAERYALLVGINQYRHDKLTPLKYAVNDVTELGKVLKDAGYQITLLTDEAGRKDAKLAPTKANIDKHLHDLARRCEKGDTFVLALTGHGLQFGQQKDAYYCPIDARPFEDETKTLVSVTDVYHELEKSYAGAKIVLVDACRNDPTPGRGRGLDADTAPAPPKGVGVLFSCSAGQRAFEHEDLKHGVFFHYVLQGLRKEAADKKGRVTFDGLQSYVREEVPDRVHALFPDQKPDQAPNVKGDFAGKPVVVLTVGESSPAPAADEKPTLRVVAGKKTYRVGDDSASLEMVEDGVLRWKNRIVGTPRSVAVAPDGEHVVVVTDSRLQMHDATIGREAWTRDGISATNVAFSRNGELVIVTTKDGRSTFDRRTGAQK